MDSFNLDGFLPYQMVVVATRMSKEFSKLYKHKFGITVPEWRVVAHLSQSGTVSVREIHKRVDMDKSKVSRAAGRLEELGFVQKADNPLDGRLVALTLTEKGEEMMAELAPLAAKFNSEILAELGVHANPFCEGLSMLFTDETESNQA